MTTLAIYRTQVLAILGDPAGTRYPASTLDAAIRQAIAEYSAVSPYMASTEISISSAGRDQSFSALASVGLMAITQVYYPYTTDEESPTELDGWHFYETAGTPAIHVHQLVPQAGEKFYIRYARSHTLDDLDSETTTTIPDRHQQAIIQGSASLAVYLRIGGSIESYSTDKRVIESLMQFAGTLRRLYEAFLRQARAASARREGPLPHAKWEVDAWDL